MLLGVIWQHLEIFLTAMTLHLVGRDQDASKYPTRHRTAPTTNSYPIQNVNNDTVETL